MYSKVAAQDKLLSGNKAYSYIDQIPALAANAQQAYDIYYPKGKKTIYKQFEDEVQAQINTLADKSAYQSSLLSMLAKRYDEDGKTHDFSKVTIAKDKGIQQLYTEANTHFHIELDHFVRAVNAQMDAVIKERLIGIPLAERMLAIHREHVPAFAAAVKKVLKKLDDAISAKGYGSVIEKNETSHPYYIQLLEIRGIMLDRVLQVYTQVNSSNIAAAMTVDACKKYPESCK